MTYRLYSFIGGFILDLNYEDGTSYHRTEDIKSIRNFFQVIGSVQESGAVSDKQASDWYKLDKAQGLVD